MKASRVPDRPSLDGLEAKWSKQWEAAGTYHFDRSKERPDVFSIDTPPPTVSGSLHIGHVFSYSHTDMMARFQRMRGKAVFYPIGWDDNGLATERRVQNYFGVRCDPTQPYDPGFQPPSAPFDPPVPIARPNFIELCLRLTAEDEQAFEGLLRLLGLSYDWRHHYTTIGERARRASQLGFLRMLARDEAYRQDSPTLWDVDFRTAVAQAELEDRPLKGAYHRVRFARAEGGSAVEIDTTRPELIPACVALVAHPSDERYKSIFGTEVLTPLFAARVPVLAHRLAEPDKGTGIAMICTFGDLTDVTWWRELSLPTRTVIQRDGRFGEAPFGNPGWESDDPERARRHYGQLAGRTVKQAQQRVIELLRESDDLVGEPREVAHAVKFYERGEHPLEIVSSPQWYVRTMAMRDRLLQRGRELCWHPQFMRARFESWVEGLTGDWNISRQRFFGVPFPVWYRLDADGEAMPHDLITAEPERLPVDPSTDCPTGWDESQRGEPGGFVGDPDIMDTWATSSLSPQIAGGWIDDPDLFGRVFPMDLRPQAHDIIRTWLFTTIVRGELEHHQLPWQHTAISGWILDPDRKKLSKSKGNAAFVPSEPLERYGTDAVRYWSASARLGVDTAYDEQQMKVGRRLAIKMLNVSRFVLSLSEEPSPSTPDGTGWPGPVDEALDAALLASLAGIVTEATEAFERYDHSRALELFEGFFWSYCDDYVELVKARAYGEAGAAGADSARGALGISLGALQRGFAPFLPYCTEEVWSWWNDGSVHRSAWPEPAELMAAAGDGARPELLEVTSAALGAIRRRKSEASRSVRAPVARATITAAAPVLALLQLARDDLVRAATVSELELAPRPHGGPSSASGEIDVDLEWPPEP